MAFTISEVDLFRNWYNTFEELNGFDYDGDITKFVSFDKEVSVMKTKKEIEIMKNIVEFVRLGRQLGFNDLDAALEYLQEEMEDLSKEKELEVDSKRIWEVADLPGEVCLIRESYLTEDNYNEFHFWFLKELKEKGFVNLKDAFLRINMEEEKASEKCSMYGWTSFPFVINYEEGSLASYKITMKKHPERIFYRAFQAVSKELAEELFNQILSKLEIIGFITENYLINELFSIKMNIDPFYSIGWRNKKSFRLIDDTIYILSDNMDEYMIQTPVSI